MPPEPPLELFQDLKVKRGLLDAALGPRENGPTNGPKKSPKSGKYVSPRGAYVPVRVSLFGKLMPFWGQTWLAIVLNRMLSRVLGPLVRGPVAMAGRWRAWVGPMLPWGRLGRWGVRLGVGVAVVVAVAALWQQRDLLHDRLTQWVAQATGATVQKMEVAGLVYTNQGDLLAALGLQRGSSLVGFDAAAARARIEALPWVRLASVERQLPATVKIHIYEHVPLARVVDAGHVWVINPQGQRIVTDTGNQFVTLPLLQGAGADTAAAALFAALNAYPQLMTPLREAIYVGQRRWDLRFISGVTVMLPEEDPAGTYGLPQVLARLMVLENARHVLTLNDGQVDLRLRDRIVLRLPDTVGATPVTNAPDMGRP